MHAGMYGGTGLAMCPRLSAKDDHMGGGVGVEPIL